MEEKKDWQTIAVVAIAAFIIGLIVGNAILTKPQQGEKAFAPNMEKINEIKSVLEDYYKLHMKAQGRDENISLTYLSAAPLENGKGIILIRYQTSQGTPLNVYASEDYNYITSSVVKVEDMRKAVDEGLRRLEEMEREKLQEENKSFEKRERPEVKLFVMSFCPYGNAAENNLYSIKPLMDYIDFQPVYIISVYDVTDSNKETLKNRCLLNENETKAYCSLHGIEELKQDIRESIIYNLYGSKTWLEYVENVNNQCNLGNVGECWKNVAESMGLNTSEIEKEYNKKWEEIASANAELSQQYEVSGSPTLMVNGEKSVGPRKPSTYFKWICNAFLSPPAPCEENNETNIDANATETPQGNC